MSKIHTQLQLGIEAHDCNLSILERGRKVRKFKDSLGYIMFSRPTRARPSCSPSKKEKEEERELGDIAHRMLATCKAVEAGDSASRHAATLPRIPALGRWCQQEDRSSR